MPTYKLRGIDVDFPFVAYDCQLIYMEKVIQSLQEKCNALLESPTGTGKTLCLLCATLSWRKSLGSFSTGVNSRISQNTKEKSEVMPSQSAASKLPTILYTTRTHSQLRQVVNELKKTHYRPKMVVLGSREQLCIHEEVSLLHGTRQTNACRMLCQRRTKNSCKHYSRVSDFIKNNPHIGDEPIDIEDLVNIGKRFGPCPYHVSRELHKSVDIIFAPYNYLIDRGFRKYLSVDWENSILIFDEAHNLESICADAASFDLPSWLLTSCVSEAKKCIDLSIQRREESNDKSRDPDNFAILRALLLKLEKRIENVPIKSRELGFTKPGPYIYELLAELNITHETSSKLRSTIKDAVTLLEEDKQQTMQGSVSRLETINEILDIIFGEKGKAHANFYRVHVHEVESTPLEGLKGKASRTLSWWCFNPGIAMEEFREMQVGSVILTSGTLSPMDSFAQELKIDFPIRLENPHVISSNQIWTGVVSAGPSGCSFNSSYWNRDSLAYKQDLGNAIVNFARIVPDGLLVFFPSYYFLEQCIGCWKNQNETKSTTIWERICKHKKPVIEPRQSSLFPSAIEDYMSKLKDTSTSGAVFFAVCRGKVSEGLDFADHAGRAVVVTGMPFLARTDPKVCLKREYLDQLALSLRAGGQVLTGDDWYNQQASRAVNQAVGRVIRHRNDYGAIIFCDERFAQSSRRSQISLWIQPHMKCYTKFGDVVFTLTRFFRDGVDLVSRQVSSIKVENNGNVGEIKTEKPHDDPEKFSTLRAPACQDCPAESSFCLNVEANNRSSQLREVLPANRSSLNAYQNLISPIKIPFDFKRNGLRSHNTKTIDLTVDDTLSEKPNKLMVTCAAKRQKLSNAEHDPAQLREKFSQRLSGANSSDQNGLLSTSIIEHAHSLIHGSGSMQNDLADTDDGSGKKRDAKFIGHNNTTGNSISKVDGVEETKGSVFLVQVKEKLCATEYKEFVGFMKALKSKTMKIGQVLQSIARIFSGPERLHLLRGFKDYIPAKYHSLYEQYLETSTSHQGSSAHQLTHSGSLIVEEQDQEQIEVEIYDFGRPCPVEELGLPPLSTIMKNRSLAKEGEFA